MDNFTKGLVERNEMRNKALGLASTAKSAQSPSKQEKENSDSNVRITGARRKTSISSPRKSSGNELARSSPASKTPTKRTVSSKKEDADVAVEINIKSTQNVQVEVEVQECEIDENGKMIKTGESINNSLSNFDSSVQLRDSSRKNLRRLGVLYSDTDQISSPIQRTEENFCESSDGAAANSSARPIKKYNKLVSLAKEINNWDDDYSQHGSKSNSPSKSSPMKTGAILKTYGSPAKSCFAPSTSYSSPVRQNNFSQLTFGSPISSNKDTANTSAAKPSPKKLLWDKKVIDSLEAQGFTRRESTVPKLTYSYSSSDPKQTTSSSANISTGTSSTPGSNPTDSPKAAATVKTTNIFTRPKSPPKKEEPKPIIRSARKSIFQKDPADMSLKERMAIFEKNKGTAPVPKTPYGITDVAPTKTNVEEVTRKYTVGKAGFSSLKPKPRQSTKSATGPEIAQVQETVNENAAANIKTTLAKLLLAKEMTISEMQISENIRKQREEELKVVLNRFNRDTSEESNETATASSTATSASTTSASALLTSDDKSDGKRCSNGEKYCSARANEDVCQKDDDKKRSRLSNGRLYPILSDIESTTTDSEMDNYTTATVSGEEPMGEDLEYEIDSDLEAEEDEDDDPNVSIGKQILKSVTKHNDLRRSDYLDSSVDSTEVSGAIGDMDDYLNDAFDDEDDSRNYDDKGSACSDSFQYEKYPKRVSFKQPEEIPVKSKLEFSPAKSPSGSHTLVHTVSFYRKQQSASASNTPIKRVTHKDETSTDDSSSDEYEHDRKMKEECSNKIHRLLDEVMRQQNIIKQTSQALNLCASTIEFSGSSEAVEGERHLLVATHRRLACMNEVQRLKVEGLHHDQSSGGFVKEKGSLSISEIIIPLKQTYISRLATDEINGHHLLCLLKYNEYVLATKTLPTLPGLKSVKFTDVLMFNEVFADFKITLEIYGMTAQREILPHDIKYHIQTPNKKRFKTKLQESNLTRAPIQSPGGPNAVRTPALIRYGYVIFSIREIKQKCWVINETTGVSPLNGNVFMKVDSKITVDVNHSGFLTMFDDISGFGAWHRRWCRLSGNTIYYWKYPEDEKRKDALGQLDLTSICTERVDIAPRSICARLHTMLLETKREKRAEDVESLVLVPKSDHTIVRHLLAADTKDEREDWCLHLNKSLSLLKSWGHH